jgi:hypothetical protein
MARAKKKKADTAKRPDAQSGVELAYATLVVYADDGNLDQNELKTLLHIALRDGVMNDRERDILRALFNRIREEDVSGDVWTQIQTIREQHGI